MQTEFTEKEMMKGLDIQPEFDTDVIMYVDGQYFIAMDEESGEIFYLERLQ